MRPIEIALVSLLLIALTSTGQLLLKTAAVGGKYRLWAFGAGYGSLLITTIISFFLLRHLDLKFFSVIMSLNYVAVMAASAWIFGEKLNARKAAGTLLVFAGALVFALP